MQFIQGAGSRRLAATRRGFFFQAEDGIRDKLVTGVQTCALPISSSVIQINADGSRTILSAGAAAAQNRFSMMEANFSLIWGLAIQMYESTLVSDDSRVDQFLEGNHGALSAQEQRGMGIFTGKGQCSKCHAGAETSSASASSVQANGLVSGGDTGFFNTGVRRINDDLGIGASIGPLNLPLSAANPTGAQGAFKTPG